MLPCSLGKVQREAPLPGLPACPERSRQALNFLGLLYVLCHFLAIPSALVADCSVDLTIPASRPKMRIAGSLLRQMYA